MDKETFNIDLGDGYTASVSMVLDEGMRAPWEDDECASGCTPTWARGSRGKQPREAVISANGGGVYLVDYQKLVSNLRNIGGCTDVQADLSAREILDHWRGWTTDDWAYHGVIVTLLHDGVRVRVDKDSVWGVEWDYSRCSDMGEHVAELARGMADDLKHAACKEAEEKAHWAQRDVVTI
jgi:hypothetical protein